jgi:hypothetical protein
VRWLALRRQRRSLLPPEAVEYENGAEFSEGLAKYTEYRLLEMLEGRTPGPQMWWVQGFRGYDSLASRRAQLVDRMLQHMRGEVAVNNDPYGTAPLRMRLYYSGMAIGALLDRLSPSWKDRILEPEVSLTDLAQLAVGADSGELRRALEDTRREGNYDSLLAAKRRLAEEGRARTDTALARIEHGVGTGIIVDYGALETPRVALGFTPFGITVVDADRTIYAQIPIRVRFSDGSEVAQSEPMPLLHDKRGKLIRFRLPRVLSPQEVANATGGVAPTGQAAGEVRLSLPEVVLHAVRATIQWEDGDLRIVLRGP